jgi:micrococcal nuclease
MKRMHRSARNSRVSRLATAWVPALLLAALAAGCASQAAETGPVTRVFDGDTIEVRLAGGAARVRLIGVDTPESGRQDRVAEYFAEQATAYTRGLAAERRVRLESDPEGDTRDRYGRLLRYVYLPDGRMLNALILSEGYGHALTRYPFSRLDEFRALEREARQAGRGLWAPDARPKLSPEQVAAHVGSTATVCGVVASTRYLAGSESRPTFLNLGRAYPDQLLTVVIWGVDRQRFDDPETRYRGRRICVTGKIERYRGRPQIVVRDADQIAVESVP